jgi:hypothetical protein
MSKKTPDVPVPTATGAVLFPDGPAYRVLMVRIPIDIAQKYTVETERDLAGAALGHIENFLLREILNVPK